jgi:hypothetical protein
MVTSLDKIIEASKLAPKTYKEGDKVQATVWLGNGIYPGKYGVVTDTYGTPPKEGYEVDFLPNGHTVTVIPYQIEPWKPRDAAKPPIDSASRVPDITLEDTQNLRSGELVNVVGQMDSSNLNPEKK